MTNNTASTAPVPPPRPEAWVQPTQYVVGTIPETYPDSFLWSLTVERRSIDRWAVCLRGRVFSRSQARAAEPRPVYERTPSGRSDHFKDVYRFPLDEALELARVIAPKLTVNGMTAQAYIAWFHESHGEPDGSA